MRKQASDQGAANGRQQTQSDHTGRLVFRTMHLEVELIGAFKQSLHVGHNAGAGLRQRHAAPGALEQAHAAVAFHRIELSAQERLVAIEKYGGAGKAAKFTDRQKSAPLLEVRGNIESDR